jgi:small multidrug resistance pump
MHWLYLTLAILSEVAGTTCMKLSAGFTRSTPSTLMWLFYGVCFYFLTLTLKKVDVSVAYAIWSGVGTALIATVGVLYFREPMSLQVRRHGGHHRRSDSFEHVWRDSLNEAAA